MATTTTRWVREGELLHLHAPDGRRLARYDPRTGAVHLHDRSPTTATEVRAAVEAHVARSSPLRGRRPVAALATRLPSPRTSSEPVQEQGPAPEDLRERLPGEHVTRLLVGRGAVPGRRRWSLSPADPFGPALRHAHESALGQQRVAAVLASLGDGWHVLHAVPTSARSWLDHLLVGPGGVVVLRTATHPGETVRITGSLVRAGGRPVSHVRRLEEQLRTVTERLRGADLHVPVRGLVVAVGARSLQVAGLPTGLAAVRLEDMTGWLAELPTVLSRVDVSRLARAAARPSTWPTEADLPACPQERRRRREEDQAALARLSARSRVVERLRRARRAAVLGTSGVGGLAVLAVLRPDALPQAVSAVGMIGG